MAERASFNVAELLGASERDLNDMLKAAVECYTDNEFVKAEAILVGLLAFDPQHIGALKLLASTLLLLDRHSEAEVMYQRAHELDPKDLYTLGALAEIKLRVLDVDGALPLFEQLFAADPQREHPAANRGRQVVHDYHLRLAKSS